MNISLKASKPKAPPNPERLIVAALAANGLNRCGPGSDPCDDGSESESGTTPFWPWKTLNALSKLGPSSNIGPFVAPLPRA